MKKRNRRNKKSKEKKRKNKRTKKTLGKLTSSIKERNEAYDCNAFVPWKKAMERVGPLVLIIRRIRKES